MRHISDGIKRAFTRTRETERGEMMRYFCAKLNRDRIPDGYPKITMGRMGKILEKIPTKDLYYLQRICDDSKNFSKKFWWEIDPKNHEGVNSAGSKARQARSQNTAGPRGGRQRTK